MKPQYMKVGLLLSAGLLLLVFLNACRFSAKKSETIKAVAFTELEQSQAVESVKKFLAEMDSESGQTWDQLSQSFKASTSEVNWSAVTTTMKIACGRELSRGSAQAVCTNKLPDSPPGRYFVFEIPTKFEKADLTERVVLVLENERWKVAGYFRRKTIIFNDEPKKA